MNVPGPIATWLASGTFLIAGLLLAACGNSSAPAGELAQAPPTLPFISAGSTRLTDALGREVILRGYNVIALRSDRNHPPYRNADGTINPPSRLFDLQDLDDADFDFIASMGVNALRLVVTWEFAQPDPPPAPYNEIYFRLIDDFIAKARAHGLYVVFDFGQFGWGRITGGNAGAPDWTVNATCRALPNAPANLPPQASGSAGCAYFDFWTNEKVSGVNLQDAYLNLWRYVARRYRDEPAVAMYDLYNEPFGGPLPPGVFELGYLYPFYQKLSRAIREIDPRHTVAFQPEILHSLGVPTPFATPLDIPNSIYIPHEYTIAYFTQRADPSYTPLQDDITQTYLDVAASEAATYKTPWMIGETGWTRSTSADGVGSPIPIVDADAPRRFAHDFTAAADDRKLGWLWFAYSSADPAYGINYSDKPDLPLIAILSRPFPRAIAGQVQSFHFDPDSGEYRQSTTDIFDQASEIALPLSWQYPQGACIYDDQQPLGRIDADGTSTSASMRFDAKRQVLRLQAIPATLRIERGTPGCPG
ncbi:MAG: cellulase family glycosylhydrolase [Stenotrophobium sp.]